MRIEGPKSAVLAVKNYIRQNLLPRSLLIIAYPVYSLVSPKMNLGVIIPNGDIYKIVNVSGKNFYIPDLTPNLYALSDLESGKTPESIEHNLNKYTSDNLISISECDFVVDIGAFIGAVSIGVAENAKKVIAVEPSEKNAECIRHNAKEFGVEDKLVVIERPVYSEQTTMTFNLSSDPTDNSLIKTDTRQLGSRQIETTTIDELSSVYDIPSIDFLKMDAEGVEPEVLLGSKRTPIEQVAIDCSAEREGRSSYREVNNHLLNRGYETNRVNLKGGWDVIYGKLI